ncbi:MAG TPA: TIGR03936 family radical SAM-associated protein [Marmoricola sp.]|nr:TIGR03936 family radical SAM-associated protein [Marmoricola sp.]
MREQPEQQAPPVQRLRIQYAKRGRLRFTSHRDFSRAFERAISRARVPMAYSSGFNPHPRISYAGASPTGAASEAEYLEIGLAEVQDPAVVARALDASLPPGLDIVDVVVSKGGSLADELEASVWQITLTGVEVAALADGVQQLLDTPEVTVERMTKKGLRTFDARASIAGLEALPPAVPDGGPSGASTADQESCAILQVVLRHGTPSVRPDDVLAALREISGISTSSAALSQRLAQGPLDLRTGTVGDPLAPDRDAAG